MQRYAREHSNIAYLGRVPPEGVPLVTAACDVVYYGLDTTNPNLHYSAPNKLYEAIAAGKPLVAGDFGEVGQTIRQSSCGILADTSTADGVRAAMEQIADASARARLAAAAAKLQSFVSLRLAQEALLAAYDGLCTEGEFCPAGAGGLSRGRSPRTDPPS